MNSGKVDQRTGVRTRILPLAKVPAPLLVLELDQGQIGCAGAAFLIHHMHMMVIARFDKIHRLVRDLKLAENCCKKIWVKAKLWSAYLFSINKRPFGSGANAIEKEQWMNMFAMQYTADSALFWKHLPMLALHWDMPSNTREEREAIFQRVLESPSFSKHMSHPKLSNWFAWNKCAHEQLDEFFAGRMVYESQLDTEVRDPDTGFGISAGVDPRKELQAILKGGGGLKLAYKLMKDDLYAHAKIMSTYELHTYFFIFAMEGSAAAIKAVLHSN